MSITGRLSAKLFLIGWRSGLAGAGGGTELFMGKNLNPFCKVTTSTAAGRLPARQLFRLAYRVTKEPVLIDELALLSVTAGPPYGGWNGPCLTN